MANTIGIYGSGQIGKNLAILFAGLGLNVKLLCRDKVKVEREILPMIRLAKKMNQSLMLENVNIVITENINDLSDANLIIECVKEKMDIKVSCLRSIGTVIAANTIIASTTSTKSITELSSALPNKSNFVGLHFFNPPTLINFLELVCGEHTSDETLDKIIIFLDTYKLKHIVLRKENPGFIVNRALFLMLNEAIFELHEGLATAEQIDMSFKSGLNHPMGPIELCDFIGLDIVLDILQTLQDEYNDQKYRPCYLLKQKVRAGKLGRKAKEGFYKYK